MTEPCCITGCCEEGVSRCVDMRWRSSLSWVRDLPAEGSLSRADSKGEMRGGLVGLFLFGGGGSSFGGDREELSPLLRPGWVRSAADLTRREGLGSVIEDVFVGESERWMSWWMVRGRCARWDCRCDTEPGVALPELEPVPLRKRDMPSAGMLGSWLRVESWLWLKAGEPVEPFGVMVAETEDIFGAALCVLRLRRRWVTSSAFGGWE